MDLTPEERQRIYLEEKARLETRQKIEGEKTGAGKVLGIIALSTFGALAVLMIAVPALEHSDPPAAPGSSAERTLSLDWQCIPGSEDAAVQFNLAMAHKDLAAAAGHATRDGALSLDAGTKLNFVLQGESSLSLVRVTSGLHDGEKCWLPSNLVR